MNGSFVTLDSNVWMEIPNSVMHQTGTVNVGKPYVEGYDVKVFVSRKTKYEDSEQMLRDTVIKNYMLLTRDITMLEQEISKDVINYEILKESLVNCISLQNLSMLSSVCYDFMQKNDAANIFEFSFQYKTQKEQATECIRFYKVIQAGLRTAKII